MNLWEWIDKKIRENRPRRFIPCPNLPIEKVTVEEMENRMWNVPPDYVEFVLWQRPRALHNSPFELGVIGTSFVMGMRS